MLHAARVLNVVEGVDNNQQGKLDRERQMNIDNTKNRALLMEKQRERDAMLLMREYNDDYDDQVSVCIGRYICLALYVERVMHNACGCLIHSTTKVHLSRRSISLTISQQQKNRRNGQKAKAKNLKFIGKSVPMK